MRVQIAIAKQPTKTRIPLERFNNNIFDRIQQTLKETEKVTKKPKTVYPNETM